MPFTMHLFRACVILSLLAPCSGAADVGAPTTQLAEPHAKLTVESNGPLLAGFPVQLKLTVTNTGPTPIFYWCGGPGRYPKATLFSVAVTDAVGNIRTFQLHNGQYVQGSGNDHKIEHEQTLPAAFDPLSPGRYVLKVSGRTEGYLREGKPIVTWPAMEAEPVVIEIKADPAELPYAEAALDRRALKDPLPAMSQRSMALLRL